MTAEQAFDSKKGPLWELKHSSIQFLGVVFTIDLLER